MAMSFEGMLLCAKSQERKPRPLLEQALKCPRCESSNTKFCYYNNYSLSQPRYFCKACRRYWTKGGTLRNVPVGGGCRKNKRSISSSSSASRKFLDDQTLNAVVSDSKPHATAVMPSDAAGFPFTGLGIPRNSTPVESLNFSHNRDCLDLFLHDVDSTSVVNGVHANSGMFFGGPNASFLDTTRTEYFGNDHIGVQKMYRGLGSVVSSEVNEVNNAKEEMAELFSSSDFHGVGGGGSGVGVGGDGDTSVSIPDELYSYGDNLRGMWINPWLLGGGNYDGGIADLDTTRSLWTGASVSANWYGLLNSSMI